jgi:PAS domain S-box-containing protein
MDQKPFPDQNEVDIALEKVRARKQKVNSLLSDLDVAKSFERHWYNSRQCNIIVSREGVIVHVNPRMCEVLGYTYDEMVGTSFFLYLHLDDVKATEEAFAEILGPEGGMVDRFVNRYVTSLGASVVFMWTAFLDEGSDVVAASASVIQACITDTSTVCYCQENTASSCYRDKEGKGGLVEQIMADALKSRKFLNKK